MKMKRSLKNRFIAGFIALTMIVTPIWGQKVGLAKSSEPSDGEELVNWEIGPNGDTLTLEKKAIKKGIAMSEPIGTGNSVDSKAVAIYDKGGAISTGQIKATIIPKGDIQNASTVGFVLGFDGTSKKYITVGYNAQGWYWENYYPGGGWRSANVTPVPKKGDKLVLVLDFDFSTGKITLKCNDAIIFNNEEVTGMVGTQAGKIGFVNNGSGVAIEVIDIILPGISETDATTLANYSFPIVKNGVNLGQSSFAIEDLVNEVVATGKNGAGYALYKPADTMVRTDGGQFEAVITPRDNNGNGAGLVFGLKDSGKYAALSYEKTGSTGQWSMETIGTTLSQRITAVGLESMSGVATPASVTYDSKANVTTPGGVQYSGKIPAASNPQLVQNTATKVSVTYDTKNGKVSASVGEAVLFHDVVLPGLTELTEGRVGILAGAGTILKLSDVIFTELPYVPDKDNLKNYTNTFDSGASVAGYKNYVTDKISTFTVADGKMIWGNNALSIAVDENSPKILDATYETKVTFERFNTLPQFPQDTAEGRFGLVLRASDRNNWASACYDLNGRWTIVTSTDGVLSEKQAASGVMALVPKQEYTFKAKLVGNKISLWCDGVKIFTDELPSAVNAPGYFGFRKWYSSDNIKIDDVKIQEILEPGAGNITEEKAVLSTDVMQVTIDKSFPRVIDYTMSSGDKFYGQSKLMAAIEINGTRYYPATTCSISPDVPNKAVYIMQVSDLDEGIDSIVTSELIAEKNTMTYRITGVQNNGRTIVNTIFMPDFNLISVRSTQTGANFQGSQMTTNATTKGDVHVKVDGSLNANTIGRGYMYGFVSDDNLSAGLWSNSEEGFTAGHNTDYTRVRLTAEEVKDADSSTSYMTVGLGSGIWTYQGKDMPAPDKDLPCVKVAITSDINGDKKVNWQDGAVAYREIMHNPLGSADVPNQVAQRIVMNFGSTAANPFLKTLDNVKRVSLATDNIGQKILLKGYQNEGHDSAHPDYDDIGQRIGGAKDMNTLIEQGREYNAGFGVHINATEMYAEADAFEQSLVNGNFGWDWIDAAYGINTMYDLTSGKRQQRLEAMKNIIPDLDMVYVDAWYGSAYESTQIAKQLNGLGYPAASEWAYSLTNNSLWSHWATDKNYGGYENKGINSDVARFIGNHQKDLWVMAGINVPKAGGGNYLGYMPLLGGYDLRGFEGWQKNRNYEEYIEVLYNTNLPTKFLQHYEVQLWENSVNADLSTGLDDKEIHLSDGTSEVVAKRVDGTSDARVITLDGKKILEDKRGNENYNYSRYLIPWNWNEGEESKLYHWNYTGGETEWELPASWDIGEVVVYRLTDEGKKDETVVKVKNGKVKLSAAAKTPYVVYQKKTSNIPVTYGQGEHVVDPGFNSRNLSPWEVVGSGVAIGEDTYKNPRVEFTNKETTASISQKITDLEPTKKYTALVYVDNQSDTAKARISVECGGQIVSNYAGKTIGQNFVKSDAHAADYIGDKWQGGMQTMQVSFIVPAGVKEAKLTLSREADSKGSPAYYDDIRIVETKSNYYPNSDFVFEQGFENSEKGIYPFVHGGIEGTEDNRTHLSERHDPYTSKGFNPKGMGAQLLDDVIEGNWSLKSHALRANGLAYQTIPQNFRFEPDVKYIVSFDYQAGNPNGYEFISGDEEFSGKLAEYKTVKLNERNTTKVSFEITGAKSGNTWVGIYRTKEYRPADLPAGKDAPTKLGENDFILDNLTISKAVGSNLSFEENKKEVSGNDILSWKEAISSPKAGISGTIQYFTGAKDGEFVLSHTNRVPFEVSNEQEIENLPAGIYKLSAWVKSSGNISTLNTLVGTQNYTKKIEATVTGNAPSKPEGKWKEVTVENIVIPEGTDRAVISLNTKDKTGGGWTIFDDVKLSKYTPSTPEVIPPTGGSSGSGGSGGIAVIKPEQALTPETGWRNVEDALKKAKEGTTVSVDAKGKEKIPASIVNELRGKDINLVFDMDAYSWKINGKSVTGEIDSTKSIDLSVKKINSKVIGKAAKEQSLTKGQIMQFDIGHDGELPFKGDLTLNIGMAHAGEKVNLNYFNPISKKLDFRGSSKVSGKGFVTFGFTHASKYIITLGKPSVASVISTKTLYKSQTYTLKPGDLVKGAKVTYSSNKKSVVTIDSKGKIKAVSPGKAVITTKVMKGKKSFAYVTAVTVRPKTPKAKN